MDELTLYTKILGLTAPWTVTDIRFDEGEKAVHVRVEVDEDEPLCCPSCGNPCPRYDHRSRRWRHLDTCQFKTIVVADVPRVNCPDDGCHTVKVPWADKNSRFTQLFEAHVIDWLRVASTESVRCNLGLSWNAVDRIMQKAVARGMARRGEMDLSKLGVDEVAFAKRHEYITVISNHLNQVIHLGDDRTASSLEGFYKTLENEQKESIESISMDMWPAYINTTVEHVPDALDKIAFDKFHVMADLNKAVDGVRKQEYKEQIQRDIKALTKSKYLWMSNQSNLSFDQRRRLVEIRRVAIKTARAWAIKENAKELWQYKSETWAEKAWLTWYGWAIRSRLAPIKKAAKKIKSHLWGIINAVVLGVHNGRAESINSKIRFIKIQARGFRNRQRFKTAIYFHCGGLDLYPDISENPL